MKFNQSTIRVLVQKDYGICYDFYTEKIGLVPIWGDRTGPYTSFATKAGEPPCFAIFKGENMTMFKGYEKPNASNQSDTIAIMISTDNLEEDYKRLKDAGVHFLGEPQFIEDWQQRCTYFRDPEGNLFELSDSNA